VNPVSVLLTQIQPCKKMESITAAKLAPMDTPMERDADILVVNVIDKSKSL
jgi:hypothetical protein